MKKNVRLVVIGASRGGFEALQRILPALPEGAAAPVVVVQHRSPDGDDRLTAALQRACALPLEDAEDKRELSPGRVYFAPADYHVLVDGDALSLSTDEPVRHARPSIDVLFESAAEAFGNGVVGVVLTGAGNDGVAGLAAIRRHGGFAVVEQPATAQAPALPAQAVAAGEADLVLPLDEIGPFLRTILERGVS